MQGSASLDAVCRMPATLRARGNVSMVGLLRASGYVQHRRAISEAALADHMRAHPELVDLWTGFSDDQRSAPAWYMLGPDRRFGSGSGWRVGRLSRAGKPEAERTFPDGAAAAAHFVKLEMEALRRLWIARVLGGAVVGALVVVALGVALLG